MLNPPLVCWAAGMVKIPLITARVPPCLDGNPVTGLTRLCLAGTDVLACDFVNAARLRRNRRCSTATWNRDHSVVPAGGGRLRSVAGRPGNPDG
jgi:hypothetical protein